MYVYMQRASLPSQGNSWMTCGGSLGSDAMMAWRSQHRDSSDSCQVVKQKSACVHENTGLSENSVPLIPMVNDHYPY